MTFTAGHHENVFPAVFLHLVREYTLMKGADAMDDNEKIYLGDIAENTAASYSEEKNDISVSIECAVFLVVIIVISILLMIYPQLAELLSKFFRDMQKSGIIEMIKNFPKEIKNVFV